MKTLFIDTHSDVLIMSYIDDMSVETITKDDTRSHSEVAIPTLQELLKKCNATLNDIEEIIIVNGPGSFTGVRIGVTIAKTIAYSLNIKIKTITSLEAYGVSSNDDYDVVCINDNKGVYSALYKNNIFTDFSYRKNSDFSEFIKANNYRCTKTNDYDYFKILDYLKNKKYENPHKVNPVYIKEIDALK